MTQRERRRGHAVRLVRIAGMVMTLGFAVLIAPAFPQNIGQVDLSMSYLNVSGSMHGASVQMSVPISRRWSVVGEFDWASGRDCAGCDPIFRDLAGLAGIRFAWRPTGRISPFWQVLAGGLHSTAEGYTAEYCCGLGLRYQQGYTVNYFALQRAEA